MAQYNPYPNPGLQVSGPYVHEVWWSYEEHDAVSCQYLIEDLAMLINCFPVKLGK